MAGAARFPNMATRGPTPNEPMPDKRTRPRAMAAAEGLIVVNAPVSDVYERWLAFEDYPKFITVIKRVRKLDANHFVASLRFHGKQYETTLEMMLRVQDRRLAWRTFSDGRTPAHLATGVVSFVSDRDRMTRITLKLTSSFGGAVGRRIDRYLRNFKRLIEEQIRESEDV
ncbi:MAG TPA: SRPBCC family protein [Chthoniobacterales bacterium]|nr:SRPBCC family protein [Chthoniobacterales bacterium]